MINIRTSRFENGAISGFTVKGHAGYAEAGSDIICAAVSALCYTAAGYFESAKPGEYRYEFEEKDGYMKLELLEIATDDGKTKAGAVMDAWLIGVRQIRSSYGGRYIKIIDTKTGGTGYVKN